MSPETRTTQDSGSGCGAILPDETETFQGQVGEIAV